MKSIFSLFILVAGSLYASERVHLTSEVSNTKTSDDFNITNFKLQALNNRRNLFWNYANEEEKAFDFGVVVNRYQGKLVNSNYSSNSAQLILGRKWSKDNYSSLKLGRHKLDYRGNEHDIINFELTHYYKSEHFQGSLTYLKDFQFLDQQIPGSLQEGLYSEKWTLYLESRKFDHFRIPFKVNKTYISDDNSVDNYELVVYYGRYYPNWWWVGYGLSSKQYKNSTSSYWSPESFTAHGPRFEIAYPLINLWVIKGGINYNFIKEKNVDAGTSIYSSLAVQYGDRDEWQFTLSWTEIHSEQAGSDWDNRGYNLNFEKSF